MQFVSINFHIRSLKCLIIQDSKVKLKMEKQSSMHCKHDLSSHHIQIGSIKYFHKDFKSDELLSFVQRNN